MRIGLFIAEAGIEGSDVATVQAQARWAEAHGFSTGWVPHIPWSLDGLTALALAGQVTERIELGSAVMPTWSRHPYAMAQQAFTTQAALGGRLVLGLGPSHPEWVENAYGASYEHPLRHVREYLSVMESALSLSGKVDFVGETYRSTSVLDVPGASRLPIMLAALGPKMLQLAGERTTGTITWMGDERAHAEHVVPRITSAAKAAGLPAPRVVAGLPVAVSDDARAGREAAARRFAIYEQIPTYARMLARGDADGAADVCVVGTEREVVARLRSYAATGITDLLASVFPVGDDEARSRRRTLALLASLTPELDDTLP